MLYYRYLYHRVTHLVMRRRPETDLTKEGLRLVLTRAKNFKVYYLHMHMCSYDI